MRLSTAPTDFQVLKRIVDATGLELMVDAGVTSMERAESLLENGVSKLVVGTETLQNKSFVGEAVKAFGSDRVIVSLDLKGDKVLVKPGFDGCTDPCAFWESSGTWVFRRLLFWIWRG